MPGRWNLCSLRGVDQELILQLCWSFSTAIGSQARPNSCMHEYRCAANEAVTVNTCEGAMKQQPSGIGMAICGSSALSGCHTLNVCYVMSGVSAAQAQTDLYTGYIEGRE